MRDTLPFLQRLGLDAETDARAIRRAYARELKLIDQARDAAGFQELREAYETALQWEAWHARQQAEARPAVPVSVPEPESASGSAPEATPQSTPEPGPHTSAPDYGQPRTPVTLGAPVHAPPPATAQPDQPPQLAAAVFAEFRAAVAALLQERHVQHPAQWQAALQASLDDERLLNISARTLFEAHIAQLLAAGWQPGHEVLFVVAGKLFNWNADRRRLRQLGRAGALIDQAIDERAIFDRLPESELMLHRAAIALLRKHDAPSDYQLRGDMPYVEKLMAYFPVWMPMMVDLEVVKQWRLRYGTMPAPKKSWLPKFNIGLSPRVGWILFVVLLQLARVAFQHSDRADDPAPASFPRLSSPHNSTPEYIPLPEHLRQDIQASIPAFPLALGAGTHQAEFNIVLDENGNIYQMMMYRTSDSLPYDEAASKALRAAQPFAANIPRKFQATFTVPTGTPP